MKLSEKIKLATFDSHQALEKRLVALLKSARDVNDYGKIPGLFYRFYGGLEAQTSRYVTAGVLPDMYERSKISWLASDLKALGASLPDFAPGTQLPQVFNLSSALGAMYVMEGSSLGGQIICSMLLKRGLASEQTLRFFSSYGENTQMMWERFKQVLDNSQTLIDEQQVIDAARDTFGCFGVFIDSAYLFEKQVKG